MVKKQPWDLVIQESEERCRVGKHDIEGETGLEKANAKTINDAVVMNYDKALEEVLRKGIEPSTENVFLEIARIWNKRVLVASSKRNR